LGEYILVLNVDLVLEDTFIEELVRALEKNATAGWAAGRLLKLTDSGKSERIDCLGHHMSRCRYATETDYSRPFDWNEYNEDMFVFGASACAALYRRTALNDLQLNGEYFDEDFFAYFEDVDLDWRAQQRGWKCLYASKAVGYHMRGGSGLIKQREIAACFLANRWLMLVKNDELRHFTKDLIPFINRLASDLCSYGWANPLVLTSAAKRFIKYLPMMLRKRKIIKAKRMVPLSYVRTLIR
jgi:GT2 family glycosyltransferase